MHPVYYLITATVSALLGNTEGIYQLESGTYPECTQRPFIQVHYDAARESVLIERLDSPANSRGWEWMKFEPLNGERHMTDAFFAISKFERYKLKKIGNVPIWTFINLQRKGPPVNSGPG